MSLKSFFTLVVCLYTLFAGAQEKAPWNKKQCAVVLTYDDALNVHLDHAVPALDSFRLKGTFYLTAAAPAFTKRIAQWEKVARNKHELANHTLFHPCDGNLPGRSWVSRDYNLATYSLRRIQDEIRMTNTVLEAVDGKKERTFAYPCGDTRVGDSLYLNGLKGDFIAARGVQSVSVPFGATDLYNVGSYMINGQTGEELIEMVKKAMQTKSLIVFLFHGVGGEHSLNVSLEAHSKLLRFLKANEKAIWNPTFIEAAKYLQRSSMAKK